MTQTEHLKLIRARCVELLEIAEKRTAGAWSVVPFGNYDEYKIEPEIFTGEPVEATGMTLGDATFVASCGTGATEAGWLATVAAVDGIIDPESSETTHAGVIQHNAATVDRICSAWPIGLLNNK
jgi:hypothetical protein